MNKNTHIVLDLHYTKEEGQEDFVGTHWECIEYVQTQSPHFMYKIVEMTPDEFKSHNPKDNE